MQFFNSAYLSDCSLMDFQQEEYHCHKVVLANKSEYFKKVFQNTQTPSALQIPIYYEFRQRQKEYFIDFKESNVFHIIIQYFYEFNFEFINKENKINLPLIYQLYAYFQFFDCKSGQIELNQYILHNFLQNKYCCEILQELSKYQNFTIIDEIVDFMCQNVKNLKESLNKMLDLPFKIFSKLVGHVKIMKNVKLLLLKIDDELVKVIMKYIQTKLLIVKQNEQSLEKQIRKQIDELDNLTVKPQQSENSQQLKNQVQTKTSPEIHQPIKETKEGAKEIIKNENIHQHDQQVIDKLHQQNSKETITIPKQNDNHKKDEKQKNDKPKDEKTNKYHLLVKEQNLNQDPPLKFKVTHEQVKSMLLQINYDNISYELIIEALKIDELLQFKEIFIAGIQQKFKNLEQQQQKDHQPNAPENFQQINYTQQQSDQQINGQNQFVNQQQKGLLEQGLNTNPPQAEPQFQNNQNVSQLMQDYTLIKNSQNQNNDSQGNSIFLIESDIKLVFKHCFDHNGAIYYLSTKGRTQKFVNPYLTKQIKFFCSDYEKNNISLEDVYCREFIDVITTNQKYSFFGLDLGVSNYLMPRCYTLGNSLSSGFVMLNWVLEASNDLKQWFVIDQRIYFIEKDEQFNRKQRPELGQILEKNAVNTWAVNQQGLNKALAECNKGNQQPKQGFRYFKIVQITKNSLGSDNLSLTGLEFYGDAYGQWDS